MTEIVDYGKYLVLYVVGTKHILRAEGLGCCAWTQVDKWRYKVRFASYEGPTAWSDARADANRF